jgi:hypothetical protein
MAARACPLPRDRRGGANPCVDQSQFNLVVFAFQIGVGPVEVRGAKVRDRATCRRGEAALHLVEVARSGGPLQPPSPLRLERHTTNAAAWCTACGSLGTMSQRCPAVCEDIKLLPANAHLAGTFLLFGRPKPGFGHWRREAAFQHRGRGVHAPSTRNQS